MIYEFEKAKDMSGRVWALAQVGRYLGKEKMLEQVKDEEKQDLRKYLWRFFLNTYGMPQEAQMKAWKWQQKSAELGHDLLECLYDFCR